MDLKAGRRRICFWNEEEYLWRDQINGLKINEELDKKYEKESNIKGLVWPSHYGQIKKITKR